MMERLSNEQIEKLNIVKENYKRIEENIANAISHSETGNKDVKFLATTKTVEPYLINYAIKLGLSYIGENRVQELLSKYDDLKLDGVSTHFIGHLQTNKVKQIISKVDLIQSVDSIKLATEISKQAEKLNTVKDVLIEINIGKEESKSGVYIEEAYDFIQMVAQLPNIKVKGLMTIPPICDEKSKIKKYFLKIYDLFIDIRNKKIDNIYMELLSMGMSSDYMEAISCGANMVRIGSALFGSRQYY